MRVIRGQKGPKLIIGFTVWAFCEQSLSHSFRSLHPNTWLWSKRSSSIVATHTVFCLLSYFKRARFQAVESLNKKDTLAGSRAVVICTDVAARGLDIPSVSSVIHYDVARAVDTFVHRAGRTAVSRRLLWLIGSCLDVRCE
jgi:hypothetical protein